MGSVRLTISLEEKFSEELKRIAQNSKKPVSQLVREALEEWLLEKKKELLGKELLQMIKEKPRATEEALKELEILRRGWR